MEIKKEVISSQNTCVEDGLAELEHNQYKGSSSTAKDDQAELENLYTTFAQFQDRISEVTCESAQHSGRGLACRGSGVVGRLRSSVGGIGARGSSGLTNGNGVDLAKVIKREPTDTDEEESADENFEDEDDAAEDEGEEDSSPRPSIVVGLGGSSSVDASVANSVFGQVKFLEDAVIKKNREIDEKNKQIETLKKKLEEESKAKMEILDMKQKATELLDEKQKEIETLTDEMEVERNAKEIIELKWKRMGKNIINLYRCFRKLIDLDTEENPLFKPIPDKEKRQDGTSKLMKDLLKIFKEKIDEAEIVRDKLEAERRQAEFQKAIEEARAQILEAKNTPKRKKSVRFNISPSVTTRSRSTPGQAELPCLPESLLKRKLGLQQTEPTNKMKKLDGTNNSIVTDTLAEGYSSAASTSTSANFSVPVSNGDDGDSDDDIIELENIPYKENQAGGTNQLKNTPIRLKQVKIELIRLDDDDEFASEPRNSRILQQIKMEPIENEHETILPLPEDLANTATASRSHAENSTSGPALQIGISTTIICLRKEIKEGQLIHVHDPSRTGDGKLYCVCGSDFDKMQFLKTHVRHHDFAMRFMLPCPNCSKTFSNLAHLKRHSKLAHNHIWKGDEVVCRDCGIIFPSKWDHRIHRQHVHAPEKPAVAGTSGQVDRPGLGIAPSVTPIAHGRNDSKDAPRQYLCLCGLLFDTSTSLTDHIKYYTQEWTHECDICKKKFLHLCYLKKHLNSARHKMQEAKILGRHTIEKKRKKSRNDLSNAVGLRRLSRNARKRLDDWNVDEEVLDWMLNSDNEEEKY